MEVPHDVGLLLPNVDGLLEFHLALDDQQVDSTRVCDMLVPVEHLPHFVSSLAWSDVQLEPGHCKYRSTKPGTGREPGAWPHPNKKRFHDFGSTCGHSVRRCERHGSLPLCTSFQTVIMSSPSVLLVLWRLISRNWPAKKFTVTTSVFQRRF